MPVPPPEELAAEVIEMHAALGPRRFPATQVHRVGGALISCTPGVEMEFPSNNPNRARMLGSTARAEVLDEIAELFGSRGVGRWFLWVGPGGDQRAVDEACLERGWARWVGAEYPLLARECGPAVALPAGLPEVRRVWPGEVTAEQMEAIFTGAGTGAFFVRTLGVEGSEQYVAVENGRPFAAAILNIRGRLGYLGFAGTREDARRRGGQTALIAARLARAAEVGCGYCASETLSVLGSSLGNLQRAGFGVSFSWSVFAAGG